MSVDQIGDRSPLPAFDVDPPIEAGRIGDASLQVQRTFAEVLEDAIHFDPDRDSAQTWLLTRAHQRAMVELRSVDGMDDPLTAMSSQSASVSLRGH